MQLSLHFEYIFADLREDGALEGGLALANSLAARRLETRLTKRVKHELDVLHASPDCVVDHFEGCLVSA